MQSSQLLERFSREKLHGFSHRLASVRDSVHAAVNAWRCRARLSEPACS
jgi:hypothetical protein